jgi:hypothetical protein
MDQLRAIKSLIKFSRWLVADAGNKREGYARDPSKLVIGNILNAYQKVADLEVYMVLCICFGLIPRSSALSAWLISATCSWHELLPEVRN